MLLSHQFFSVVVAGVVDDYVVVVAAAAVVFLVTQKQQKCGIILSIHAPETFKALNLSWPNNLQLFQIYQSRDLAK